MRIRLSSRLTRLQDRIVSVWPRMGGMSLACLAAACLVGCTTLGPDYQRPEVSLPKAWRVEPVEFADVANTAWWEAFGDADLNALIKDAIDANKDLLLAALRVEQFDARLQIRRAAQYPQVGYAGSAAHQRYSEERPILLPGNLDPIRNAFLISSNVGWELDLWGRLQRANEAALADLLATEEARRAVMLTVVTSVTTSYIQLLALDRQLALARQLLKNREDAAALIDTKYQGGSATLLAVAEARAAADEAAGTIPDIEREIAVIENALSSLLGRNTGPIQRRRSNTLALPPVPQGVPSDVLTRRPDVLAAEQNLVSANALIGVAKAEYFPVISLTGELGLGSDDLPRLLMHSATTGAFGAGLLGTIFSGGRIEGNIRQTEAVQKQMVVRYQQAVQTALREVEDALVFRAKSGEREAAISRQVDSVREVVQLSKLRYEGGWSTYLEVLDAERQLYAVETQQVQRQRDTYVALILVYKAMGGGWMVEQDKLRAPKAQGDAVAAISAADVQAPAATRQETKK